jgi:hypothetical protein
MMAIQASAKTKRENCLFILSLLEGIAVGRYGRLLLLKNLVASGRCCDRSDSLFPLD